MSTARFTGALTAGAILSTPFMLLFWLYVLAEVNFHDVLGVAVVVAVWWQLRGFRREERAAERAWRRVAADRAMRDHLAYAGVDAEHPTGPVEWPEPSAWAA